LPFVFLATVLEVFAKPISDVILNQPKGLSEEIITSLWKRGEVGEFYITS
jgi:hypothetical protein